MAYRIVFVLAAMFSLSACVVTPRIELSESLYFDYAPPDQKLMNYGDLMCMS